MRIPIKRALSPLGLTARLAVAVAFAAALSAACSDSNGPGTLTSITVTPNAATLSINGTQQFVAVGKDSVGVVVPITPTWSVVAGGGTISTTGLFTAGTVAGTFTNTVKVASGSLSVTVTVIVTAGALGTVTVTPNPATVPLQGTQQFTAVGKDAGGNVVTITPTWSVVALGGTISASGLFTAGATSGTFTNTVKATSGTFSGTATVIVSTSTGNGGGTGTGTGHGPAPVVLGAQGGTFVILAKSGVSNVPTSAITGNVGVSPALATAITGFTLTLPAGGAFATSAQVTGNVYAPDYAEPTPTNLTAAVGEMETAYTTAAGRTLPDYTELGAGNIGGLTLAPGLYKWGTTVLIPTSVTLSGGANDTWIFQIAGGLTQSSATSVILTGGALAQNVVWQVAQIVDIGTTAHMEGRVMSLTGINLHTGAVANGRLFAQTAVTLDGNTVVVK